MLVMTNGKKPIEAFALSRVPREQRKSWVDMVMVQAGMVICIPAFLLGSMLAEGMPTLQAMVAGVIGYGMVLVLTLILGIQGADLGIPTCAISIFWGMVMVVIAVWGMETLKNLDTISVPLLLLIMIIGTVMAFRIYGTAFSFFSASAFTAADLTRFQRNRRDTVKSAVWGLMPAGIITCVIGVLLSRVVGVYDISQVMAMVGLPILGLTIMILAQLTTNSVNAYTGGLDAVMTFNLPDNRRREATFVVGVLGVVLAVLGILDFIEVYLNWTTFLGAPIAGVMIADYWIVGRGKPASWHPNDGWNRTGIAATLISLVIALMIPVGVFNFNGVIIGFIVYLILEHFWPSESRNN